MKIENILTGKRVLVGVTGSIAIYKSLQLIRLLTKAGAEVRVIMSDSAKKFITPLTFETLSSNRVLHSDTEDWSSDLNHIAIGKWADTFVIAPATANSLNKIANGIADTILLQTALAYSREILLAPSANTQMLYNPISEASIKLLKLANYTIIGTEKKELACKTEGDGAMAEPEEIFYQVARSTLKESFWENRRVVITGGGTVEQIDEVRFISNFSSGKMSSALALALYFKGADVCFISTKFPDTLPKEMCYIEVESGEEMYGYLEDSIRVAKKGVMTKASFSGNIENIQKKPFLFMGAAVADYVPKYQQSGKLKSKMIGSEWNLELKESRDILKTINKDGIVTIGFKAEMDSKNGVEYATNMLKEKSLDGVCLNLLSGKDSFGTDTHQIDFIKRGNVIESLPKSDKLSLSFKIIEKAKELE